ncbi:MAG TPA: TolC family protein [Candidatus Paceibacterota bacterium]|nr:TolC family protein [Verrucomicrobiota bacterium]HRY46570.1 TolC family protein [Candidatus Paceibacterota bacterium]
MNCRAISDCELRSVDYASVFFKTTALAGALVLTGTLAAQDVSPPPPAIYLSLQDCILKALEQNRDLQIERLNPLIAGATLSAGYGVYDPLLTADAQWSDTADSGGFDPADLSRDAIYQAKANTVVSGLTGLLPFGMTYQLGGTYANSYGTRNTLDFESYNLRTAIAVRQPLLKNFWTDQSRLAIRVNKSDLKITELGVHYLTMSSISQVMQAYYELVCSREQFQAQERLRARKDQTCQAVRRKIELGALSVLDEKLAQAQLARVDAALVTGSNLVVLAESALRALMGGYSITNATVRLVPLDGLGANPEHFDLQESCQRGLAHRPDLLQLKQDVEKAIATKRFRRNQLFPSLDLVAGYGRRGASTQQVYPPDEASASFSDAFEEIERGAAPNEMIGVIFSLPLSRTAERANYRASQHLKDQAELRVIQREELVIREITDALNTARSCWNRIETTSQAVRWAQGALADEEQKLASGKSTLFFVLQLQSDLAEAEALEIRARGDYHKALAWLQFVDASILQRQGVDLEVR